MVSSSSSSARRLRRWGLVCAGLLLLLAFHHSPFGRALDRAFFDLQSRQPFRAPTLPEADSAFVLIDDHTMGALGRELTEMRWPFPRWAFAGLIAALDRAGAEKIVVDLLFLDPSDREEFDQLLAGVAAASRRTILARTSERGPVFWNESFVRAHPQWFETVRTGNVIFRPDDDGVARSYRVHRSLAAAALPEPIGEDEERLLRWHGGLRAISAKYGARLPVLSAQPFLREGERIARRLMNAAPDFDSASIGAALAVEPMLTGKEFEAVKGRTVFVGANAAGTFDVKPTPVGRLEPGVLVHWTAWANLATGEMIRALPRGVSLLGGAMIGALLLGVARARPGLGIVGSVALLAMTLVAVGAYGALSFGWFFPPATPLVAGALTIFGVAAENFWSERQRKWEIQAMFGSYVAPAVVEQLVRDPNAIRLGGERREATVFFCDLAGFTDLSEKISPDLLLQIINRYLQETSDSLMAHGAYIDKYIGDAVMAVFGVPNALPNHALAACEGALAASRAFARFSDEIAREHGYRPSMRIGINTGSMIVGNLGSERKKNYTVLGDAVNLASRLEGANKEFGTSIMLGETTARLVQEHLVTRPLSRLRVKGKSEAVEVHELIGRAAELSTAQQSFVSAYCEGYRRYVAREFAGATAAFDRALQSAPEGERLAAVLRQRAAEFAIAPPAANWEPILNLDSK